MEKSAKAESRVCVAFKCSNSPDDVQHLNQRDISFHTFPDSDPVRSTWIRNCRWLNWTPTATNILCSAHFASECFNEDRSLKANAAPTLFDYPPHLQLRSPKIRTKRKRNSDHSYSFPDASAELGAKLKSVSDRCSRLDERNKTLTSEIKSLKRRNERLTKQLDNTNAMTTTSSPVTKVQSPGASLQATVTSILSDHSRIPQVASENTTSSRISPCYTDQLPGSDNLNPSKAQSFDSDRLDVKRRSDPRLRPSHREQPLLKASDDECQEIDQEWLERRKRLSTKRHIVDSKLQPQEHKDQDVVDEQNDSNKTMFFVLSEDGGSATAATQEQIKELLDNTEGIQTKVEDLVVQL